MCRLVFSLFSMLSLCTVWCTQVQSLPSNCVEVGKGRQYQDPMTLCTHFDPVTLSPSPRLTGVFCLLQHGWFQILSALDVYWTEWFTFPEYPFCSSLGCAPFCGCLEDLPHPFFIFKKMVAFSGLLMLLPFFSPLWFNILCFPLLFFLWYVRRKRRKIGMANAVCVRI